MYCLNVILIAIAMCLLFYAFIVMYNQCYHDDPLYGMRWGKHVCEYDIRRKPNDQK
jgi:hypothetical protein